VGVVGPQGYVPTKQDWMKQVSGRGGEVMLAILDIRKGRIQVVCVVVPVRATITAGLIRKIG
jgi:hypothetical protein